MDGSWLHAEGRRERRKAEEKKGIIVYLGQGQDHGLRWNEFITQQGTRDCRGEEKCSFYSYLDTFHEELFYQGWAIQLCRNGGGREVADSCSNTAC